MMSGDLRLHMIDSVLGKGVSEGVVFLAGGASDRWYARLSPGTALRIAGVSSAVIMGVPAKLWRTIALFEDIQMFLASNGIPVPSVYARFPRDGIVVIEDLGDVPMVDAVRSQPQKKMALAGVAVDTLARIHTVPVDNRDDCEALKLHFDRSKYLFEFGFHVMRWVMQHYDAVPTPRQREILAEAFWWTAGVLADEPRVFTHRDYQSSNLMLRENGTLAVIDFQDARQGLRQYDLASLLYDSYVDYSDGERGELTIRYLREAGVDADNENFHTLLRVAAIQRKLHDVGAFVYTAHHRGKQDYLRHVASTMEMILRLMVSVPETEAAGEVLRVFTCKKRENA